MSDTIGFIGAGRIARIMLEGLSRAGALPRRILVHDPSAAAVAALRARVPGIQAATLAEAAGADLVFGALHPPALSAALAQIAPALRPTAVFCSLAPRVKLAALRTGLGGFSRLARQNPNAPSIVGAGYNPVAFDPALPAADRDALLAFLAPLGRSPEVDEATLETYAVISAMGPTYLWFQLQRLRELAQEFGLDAAAADAAVEAMALGATATLFHGGLPPAEVMDLLPVKPLVEDEPAIRAALENRLRAVHAKLRSPA
jgi:pyrroline-5-carboxylate reductase